VLSFLHLHLSVLPLLSQVLGSVAEKHGTTISNVASRWVLQRPAVPAVILGARNATHVPDHQQLFAFSLDEGDLSAIQEVLDAGQQPKGDCYTWERGGVF
jgi:aryl-alcohol dehydrogenase-like predicted oxidoreductase